MDATKQEFVEENGFVSWLDTEPNDGKSVFRPRSTGRWLRVDMPQAGFRKKTPPFSEGKPFERISDLVTRVPPAKGLSKLRRSRVLAAADKLCGIK
jgi:hypothetical protein